MLLDPDPVPGAVDEVLAQPGLGDDGPCHGVDVLGGDPGSHRVHGGLLRGQEHRVGVRAPRPPGSPTATVRVMSEQYPTSSSQHVLTTEVAHHGVARLDDALARLVVRARPVGPAAHDGEVDPPVPRGEQPHAQRLRHLGLAPTGQRDLAPLEHRRHAVGGLRRGPQRRDLTGRPSRPAAGT